MLHVCEMQSLCQDPCTYLLCPLGCQAGRNFVQGLGVSSVFPSNTTKNTTSDKTLKSNIVVMVWFRREKYYDDIPGLNQQLLQREGEFSQTYPMHFV